MIKIIILSVILIPFDVLSNSKKIFAPVNVENQISKFGIKNIAEVCLPVHSLPHKVKSISYYTDENSSVIDKHLLARSLELRKTVSDAQNYLATQNNKIITSSVSSRSKVAECSIKHLLQFAKDDAFTGSDDIRGGGAIRLMSVTPLMSYLILRDTGSIKPEQDLVIRSWISRLVDRLLWLEKKYKYNNNIEDWTGAAFALSAVALNRVDLLHHAIEIYYKKEKLVNLDGFLPLELNRGQMAVEYSLSALQALSIIISVAQANDNDLLTLDDSHGIFRMMKRMVGIIENPDSFLPYAKFSNSNIRVDFESQNMGWLINYYMRTNDMHALNIICNKNKLYSWRTGGDWIILFGNPNLCY